jgi:hypothetical protein
MEQLKELTHIEKRDYLLMVLREKELIVEFTKVTGEIRKMPCTLLPSKLPVVTSNKPTTEKKENLDTIRVFCTDKDAWRSFRVENVISVAYCEIV